VDESLPGGASAPLALTCRHRTVRQVQDLQARMATDGLTDGQILGELIQAWQVKRADGTDVPYSSEALAELLDNFPAAGPEIYRGYVDALRKGRLGN
jgi:hypothetical protein